MKVRCLAFLDNALGRDTEILLPITYVMEEYFNISVEYLFIWDLFLIRFKKPDIILVPSTRGHPMYVEIADFAKEHGIKVFALDSEGNYPTDGTFDYWGYNKKRVIYQEWITCWSERTAKFMKRELPHLENRIIVSGGTGFDRYLYSNFPKKEIILKALGKHKYDKVIGYAGWAFARLYSKQLKNSFKRFFPENRDYALKWIEEQRLFVKKNLEYVIRNNKEVLFILKKHPKENLEDEPLEGPNEMNELLHYPNVVYVKNEIPVEHLIYISDIWMGFETTTLFEAWALDKPTILINQVTDFPRTLHYKGSIISNNESELNKLISEHFNNENLKSKFTNEQLQFQKEATKDSIGYFDGFNHLRTAFYFSKNFPKKHKEIKIRFSFRQLRLFLIMHFGKFFYFKKIFLLVPKLRKVIYVYENRNLPGFEERRKVAYGDLKKFHIKNGLYKALSNHDWKSTFYVINK